MPSSETPGDPEVRAPALHRLDAAAVRVSHALGRL